MNRTRLSSIALLLLSFALALPALAQTAPLSGGVRMIPVSTPQGEFRVWTKRVGDNPAIKVLLLHGGPGLTHEYFEGFDSFLPGAGVEYYYYDQLGSAYSDQPADMAPLLSIDRYVEEVEQVRKALGLDSSNFYLLGQSWGGLLATEYALKYQQNLKGLVISNMMSSIPEYNRYAAQLMAELDPAALAEVKRLEAAGKHDDPSYMQLLQPHYERHFLRLPSDQWPEPVVRSFSHLNPNVYVPMQGPSELGASGILVDWDRTGDLERITVPTLVIGAQHDTMDPAFKRMMAERLPNGRYLHCPDGSHLAMYDDQQTYMAGLIDFLHDVDDGGFTQGATATPR